MELQKNQIAELTITGMTAEGAGVGRVGAEAVFVPLSAPGDRIRAKIVKTAKNYAFGKLIEILSPAPSRIEADCPVFAQCGGCCFRHIRYEEECRLKEDRVREALSRIGGIADPLLEPILAAPSRDGCRNKALLPLGLDREGNLQMGFYARNSHRIVNCNACRLQPEEFTAAMEAFRQWAKLYGDPVYEEASHKGKMRRLYLRKAEETGEVSVCVVVNGNGLHHEAELLQALREALPKLSGFQINIQRERTNVALGTKYRTVFGKEALEDRLCGLTFSISPASFYQVNHHQAQRLYEKAAEYAGLTGKETLLDLYCGAGTIGLSMAHAARELIGVEIVPKAVENAKENAEKNHIQNARFLCADAEEAAAVLKREGLSPDVVILDPPRKGCTPELIRTVSSYSPEKIVYVSCDPATLARDLKQFGQLGYPLQKACPVDMFPATAHVETVVLMSREK